MTTPTRAAATGAKKKPARGFQIPASVVYDWQKRRYVKAESSDEKNGSISTAGHRYLQGCGESRICGSSSDR